MVTDSRLGEEAGAEARLYEVGRPFPGGALGLEGTTGYGYGMGAHHMMFSWPQLTTDEVLSFRIGDIHLGLVAVNNLIFILYRVSGACQWSDVQFNVHLSSDASRSIPPKVAGDTRALMNIWVVDSSTGILQAMRAATMSPQFTRSLHDAIRRQAAAPFDRERHEAAIRDVYAVYPKSRDMLRIAVAKCKLGS